MKLTNSPQTRAEVKKQCRYTDISPYVFMVWTGTILLLAYRGER